MQTLVIAEHDNSQLRSATRSALTFARQIAEKQGGDVGCLVIGHNVSSVAQDAANYAPALLADEESLAQPLADRYAAVIAGVVRENNVETVVAATSTFAKDVVARAAGLLGGTMASEVVGHEFDGDKLLLKRPMYAGALLATVELHGSPKIITIRSSAYPPAEPATAAGDVSTITVDTTAPARPIEFISQDVKTSSRPDVSEAQVVISGGRALKNSEDFERLVGGLADAVGGATGSSRALVDAGITPNELQVGQTGKIVAPDLYIALGISGAVQHLAGMKNSKVIVAVNSDPDAPIFEVADYGLVGDVYEIVPQLIDKLST